MNKFDDGYYNFYKDIESGLNAISDSLGLPVDYFDYKNFYSGLEINRQLKRLASALGKFGFRYDKDEQVLYAQIENVQMRSEKAKICIYKLLHASSNGAIFRSECGLTVVESFGSHPSILDECGHVCQKCNSKIQTV